MTIQQPVDASGTSRTAKAYGLTLHYHEAGPDRADAPVVVMLHGGGPGSSGWSNFGPNLPVFAQQFRTLLVDQPGYGRSDKPVFDKPYFTYSAAALAALLDELGIDRVHLVGNSLGGGTAIRFALDFPDRVGRMVLMGPGGGLGVFSTDPTEGISKLFRFAAPPEGPTKEKLRDFLRTLVHDPALVTDELVEERWQSAGDPETLAGAARMAATFANPEWATDAMLWRDAWRITQPVLLTWGREDRTNPLDGALVPLKTMPDARLHVFPRCGHWAQLEQSDEFNRLAVDFLRDH